jgi:stringent starvation protein B
MMKPDERPSKRDAFLAFFEKGSVFVYLDARRGGVKVPPEFAGNRQLLLQYGDNMPIPIPDLQVDDDGITATLSFSRMPHRTFVPWAAVYMIERGDLERGDGKRILYYNDVPEDVAIMARPLTAETGEAGETFTSTATLVGLHGDDDDAELEDGDEATARRAPELNEAGDLEATDAEDEGGATGTGSAAAAGDAAAPAASQRKGKGKGKAPARRAAEQRLLKSVPAEPPDAEGDGAGEETAAAAATRRRKRPQLRVVK